MSETKKDPSQLSEITVTRIAEENSDCFQFAVPQQLMKEILCEKMFALGAIENDVAAGAVVFSIEDEQIKLEFIFVAEEYRRSYIGTTLFCEMVDLVQEAYEATVESVSIAYADENNGAFEFFQSLKFQLEKDSSCITMAINTDKLKECPFYAKTAEPGHAKLLCLSQASDYETSLINSAVNDSSHSFLGMGFNENVIKEISFAALNKSDILGAVMIEGDAEELYISTMFFTEKSSALPICLMKAAADAIAVHYPQTVLRLPIIEKSALKLATALLGNDAEICETLVTGHFVI